MQKILISAAFAALCLLGVVREAQMRDRLQEIERLPRADPATVELLARELRDLDLDLEDTRELLENDTTGAQRDAKLNELEALTGANAQDLAAQQERLRHWSEAWEGHAPEQIEEHLANLQRARQEDREQLEQLASAADEAQQDLARIATLDESLSALTSGRDVDRMWHELVGPVVQIAGEVTVGSGVLPESQPQEDGTWRTHLLTSWHVVRDIYGSTENVDEPVAVKLYLDNGKTVYEDASMVEYEVGIDIALLQVVTGAPILNGARIASRERLENIQVFDAVYAVGCPLGNDPIPTAGEIADVRHRIDGERYWMISAPTYIGNSGGGIFDAETHELLGIFSKIYTHGGVRSTIVPHMGLVTPLQTVYDWLDSVEYAQLGVPDAESGMPGVGVQPAGLELEPR